MSLEIIKEKVAQSVDILKEKYTINRLLPNELLPLKVYNPTMHEICGYQNIVALRKK